ncbi:MAG: MFS transporter [Armatimonadota bacterium]|nr:MFS transporter [Armatimonadota bacterium]
MSARGKHSRASLQTEDFVKQAFVLGRPVLVVAHVSAPPPPRHSNGLLRALPSIFTQEKALSAYKFVSMMLASQTDHPSSRRDWVLFGTLTFCFAFGFAVYNGIFQNFIREVLHVTPRQLGVLESLREVPGLLTAPIAGTLVAFAEPRLAGLALLVCALGIGATGMAGSYWVLVGFNVWWSIGFHLWASVSPSITLALAGGREGGRHLGRMSAIGSVAVLVALGSARLFKTYLSYQTLFLIAGATIACAGVLAFLLSSRAAGGKREPIILRREYSLYYVLTFLEGCRRQIFSTFASYVLILVYGTPVQTMLSLAFVNAALGAVAAPIVGRLVDRYGERRMLTLYYVLIACVFAGYALLRDVRWLYALFVTDSVLFSFSMGITVFLNRIVRPGELTPSLAMGTTMNHVAAVIMPALGGVLWSALDDYRIPFWIGFGVVLFSLMAVQRIALPRPSLLAAQKVHDGVS